MNTTQSGFLAAMLMTFAAVLPTHSSEIYQAAYKGDFDKVKALVAKNPDSVLEKEDKGGNSALHAAIFGTNNAIAAFLITNKADLNAQTKNGYTPLHSAVKRMNKEVIELLLKNKADVNAKAIFQITPLYYALSNYGEGMDDIIALLLDHGADPKIKGGQNEWTPLDLAKRKDLPKVVEMMKNQKPKK